MATTITDGVARINSQAEWQGCTFTPAAAADTTTTVGSVKFATGYNELTILTPVFQYSDWERWIAMTLAGTRGERTAYVFRFRTAEAEADIADAKTDAYGIARADGFSEWIDGTDALGTIRLSMLAWCKNHTEWAPGPYCQAEINMVR